MRGAVTHQSVLVVPAAATAALALGALAAIQPLAVLGLFGFALVGAITFATPVAGLSLLIFLTALVPYGIANEYGLGGGVGSPGLLVSDLFLILGLARAAIVLYRQPLTRRQLLMVALLVLFLVIAVLHLYHGLALGRQTGLVGGEFRPLLGFGAFLITLPLLRVDAQMRRLLRTLVVLGLMLGAWGIVQWVTQLSFDADFGDVGVREGIRHTTGGRGQVQGGLYAFPVAVLLAYAALLSGKLGPRGRLLVGAALVLNGISLLLTFQRTFWVATVAAILFVTLKAVPTQRAKALLALPLVALVGLGAVAALAPAEFQAASERLLSARDYSTDYSLTDRLQESEYVAEEVRRHPLGSGLAASVYFGRPQHWEGARDHYFIHNGYLWLAWKVGIPAAALLVAILAASLLARGTPPGPPLRKAVRDGAQGALIVLLLVAPIFPAFNALMITATMGMLLAFAVQSTRNELASTQSGGDGGARP